MARSARAAILAGLDPRHPRFMCSCVCMFVFAYMFGYGCVSYVLSMRALCSVDVGAHARTRNALTHLRSYREECFYEY